MPCPGQRGVMPVLRSSVLLTLSAYTLQFQRRVVDQKSHICRTAQKRVLDEFVLDLR